MFKVVEFCVVYELKQIVLCIIDQFASYAKFNLSKIPLVTQGWVFFKVKHEVIFSEFIGITLENRYNVHSKLNYLFELQFVLCNLNQFIKIIMDGLLLSTNAYRLYIVTFNFICNFDELSISGFINVKRLKHCAFLHLLPYLM